MMAWAYRLGLKALSPSGASARLSVLIFHRVLASPDPLRLGEPTGEQFEAKLRWVKNRFNVISLSEAVRGLKNGALPERPLAITFDDGYADNHEIALPILRRLGLPATFFIATGYLDGGRMFNDTVIEAIRETRGNTLDLSDLELGCHAIETDNERRSAVNAILGKLKYFVPERRESVAEAIAARACAKLTANLMMRSEDVVAMRRAGMEIGAHTVSHPILKEIDMATARREIDNGRKRLEEMIGERIGLFAYPNGQPGRDYAADHVALVRALGFDAAVSTAWGAAGPGADLYQIPRFTPWDRQPWKFGLRLARTIANSGYTTA
jgi:peptidoglycan/xylan/chitin deacetylase (PgdA/CDA1 family)